MSILFIHFYTCFPLRKDARHGPMNTRNAPLFSAISDGSTDSPPMQHEAKSRM